MCSTLTAFLLAIAAPLSVAQSVVFASPLGDDVLGDGTAGNPYRSVDRALVDVLPGGTVRLDGGSYPFAVTIGKSVTIEAQGGGEPVLGPRPSPGPIVTVSAVPDVTLRGLRLLGSGGQLGVRVLGPADRFAALGCAFEEIGGNGLEFAGLATADARVEDCSFRRMRVAGSPAAAIDASGTPGLRIRGCAVSSSDFGIRLSGVPGATVEDSTFVDLAQSAVLAIASPDLRLEDLVVTRAMHFAGPSAWASPSDQFGAISLANLGHRALLRRVLVEDSGGFAGIDRVFGRFDGLFALAIDDCDDVRLEHCALHRNEYGGLLVTGGSLGAVARDSSFVQNGSRNGPGDDVALYADVAAVDAAGCFWGGPAGPVFDGAGLGNGLAGGALVTLAPLAAGPAPAAATSLELTTVLPGGGLRPRDLAVVDLDGDGREDLVAVEDLSGSVRVHLRAGAGGFAAPVAIPVGGSPVAVVAGSFDLDGLVDLAVLDEDGDRCVILFGDGAGGFPRRAVIPTGRRPLRLAAGPLGAAGTDDLLIAAAGDAFVAGGVQFARADGAGGFSSAAVPGAVVPTDVALLDLNADGLLDLVAYDCDRAGPGLRRWLNLGAGNLSAVAPGPLDQGPVLDATLARVDLDGLGGRDLAVARFRLLAGAGLTGIDLYRNSGGGSLLGPTRIDEVLGPVEMAAGDVGERGAARLCVALPALGEVRAYGPIVPDATPFAPCVERLFDRPYPQTLGFGELDGDGAGDLVVADGATGDLEIWRGRLPAEVEIYGAGCAGQRGVPQPRWRSVPELGATSFAAEFTEGPAGGAAFLLISVLPAQVPIDGGCVLLVQPDPFAVGATSDANGYGSVPLGVPIDPDLLRGELFVQWWLLDPAGSAYGALSSTAGLRIRVGG
jgi:hypothetical protein